MGFTKTSWCFLPFNHHFWGLGGGFEVVLHNRCITSSKNFQQFCRSRLQGDDLPGDSLSPGPRLLKSYLRKAGHPHQVKSVSKKKVTGKFQSRKILLHSFHTEQKGIRALQPWRSNLLLLGHTNGPSATSSGLGVLTTHSEAPHVSQTTMASGGEKRLFNLNVKWKH